VVVVGKKFQHEIQHLQRLPVISSPMGIS